MSRPLVVSSLLALALVGASCSDGATKALSQKSGAASSPKATLETAEGSALSDAALAHVRAALAPYDELRAALAADHMGGVDERASAVAEALAQAAESTPEAAPARRLLEAGRTRARSLAQAKDLAGARRLFASLSDVVVALALEEPRLREGLHLFSCPMTTGFREWVQRAPELENPHMGQAMLRCGSEADWAAVKPPSLAVAQAGGHAHDDEIAFHTCPMHPSVKQASPGQCPICGMDLVPVTRAELESGVLFVDEGRRQVIGVRTEKIARGPMQRRIRAFGRVVADETRLYDVTLRFSGYVEALYADETGQEVKRGEPLLALYSPELYAAQQELLEAARAAESSGAKGLLRAARARLRLAGLADAQIDEVIARGKPYERLPVYAPASGFVVEKDVVDGARVEAGQRIFRIARLDRVWVEADVYEPEVPLVKQGMEATVQLPQQQGAAREGTIAFLSPVVDERTRARRVRVEVANEDRALLPGMTADVLLEVDLGDRLLVPESAVLYTGPRRLVFVDEGGGRLRPKEVRVGERNETHYAVLSGLSEGDTIVTSGAFLVASESRIRNAARFWGPAEEEVGGAPAPPGAGHPAHGTTGGADERPSVEHGGASPAGGAHGSH